MPTKYHPSSQYCDKPLDFPSLDDPYDPTSPAEMLTSHPTVVVAINRILAAAGQMTATVQTPFMAICDATMAYHLPSCMRILEASNTVEILHEAGPTGLHVRLISELNGIEESKLAHILRLLATHHILREVAPDVFTLNRISSLVHSEKCIGRPELKYANSNGIAAFVGLCTDEIYKSADKRRTGTHQAPFCYAFDTIKTGTGYFGWLEGETKDNDQAEGRTSMDFAVKAEHPNPNRFRLERFGKAMSGTGSWEAPGAVLHGFDWQSLPKGSLVVDVGGGIGSTSMLLATASEDMQLDLRFVIQDRPVVVEMGEKAWRAKCPQLLDSGMTIFQEHDFFAPQPIKAAAVFLLRVILHDWPDDYARRILLQLREAAMPQTKLLIADWVLPLACPDDMGSMSGLEGIEGAESILASAPLLPNLGKASANAYWMDLTMQVMFNAQERTLREIVALALSAGWKAIKVTKAVGSLFGHITAIPVPIPTHRRRTNSKHLAIQCRRQGSPSKSRRRGSTEAIRFSLRHLRFSNGVALLREGLTKFSGVSIRPKESGGLAMSSKSHLPRPAVASHFDHKKKRPSPLTVPLPQSLLWTTLEVIIPRTSTRRATSKFAPAKYDTC
ncbi:hypothetical protein BDQ17DRAFT_1330195 [Cyathus striatus]|nr:hypothetical protein BDQ17DRAFT_1330195 [Cyathus striatus]